MKFFYLFIKLIFINLLIAGGLIAQQSQLNASQQFRQASQIIRIAEPGELADSVNVWGDLGNTGMYLIPKGTKIVDLLSYGGGMATLRSGQTQLDWSKMRVEINVHKYDASEGPKLLASYRYRFEEPFPAEMWNFVLENNHTITVRVKRKPSFIDYLGVFASTVSAVASTIVLLDRLGSN